MNKYVTPGTITGVLSIASAIALALGKAHLAQFLGDPSTATTVGLVFTGTVGLVAGFLKGVHPEQQ